MTLGAVTIACAQFGQISDGYAKRSTSLRIRAKFPLTGIFTPNHSGHRA
jgi:hypothetical protein